MLHVLLDRGCFALCACVMSLARRLTLHFVWVDDLGLFFQVEGLLVVLELCLSVCVPEVLLVVGEDILGVGVFDESVSAASLSAELLLIAGG